MAATEITVSGATLYYGTDAEINALSATKGDVGFATDTGKEYTNTDGSTTWVVTRAQTEGSMHVRTSGDAGTLESITFTCNAATDCITSAAAPVTTELCLASGFTAGKKRARFTFHNLAYDGTASDAPFSSGALVTVNAGDETTAIARLTQPDNGPQAAYRTAFLEARRISSNSPIAEYNLDGTASTVDDIAVGFVLPIVTGTETCYVTVEVW